MESSTEVLLKRTINKEITGIIHIGADRCQEWTDYKQLNVNNVIWIDGHRKALDIGREVLESNGIANHLFIETYLSYKNDIEQPFYTTKSVIGDGRDDSILKPLTIPNSVISVNVKRLDTLFSELSINAKNYNTLIIDVQGAELKVLAGCGDILNYMNCVVLECWKGEDDVMYKNEAKVSEVKYYMENIYGFTETGRIVQGANFDAPVMDILFER